MTGMPSLRNLYRIGTGPSSSHTMAPARAASIFKARWPSADRFRVTLMGSLAATGRGHLTDRAIREALAPSPVEFLWRPEMVPAFHPNGMHFEAFTPEGRELGLWHCYSTGGGALREQGDTEPEPVVYALSTMHDLLRWVETGGQPVWSYVEECEDDRIWDWLGEIQATMGAAIDRGLDREGTLPGELHLARKARSYLLKARAQHPSRQKAGLVAAYALAVSEENAAGGVVATAPTCGACGVVPAVLRYLEQRDSIREPELLRALAVAGLFGNVVKRNASISGAEVGCQGEIGTACAMAAAAAAYLLGGTMPQIEYAAEMGLEHHLGLTCDPVLGLVQIPCIERNAFAATRAIDCAEYALLSDGRHRISFDQVVETMRLTGKDLPSLYRETSTGGLAHVYDR